MLNKAIDRSDPLISYIQRQSNNFFYNLKIHFCYIIINQRDEKLSIPKERLSKVDSIWMGCDIRKKVDLIYTVIMMLLL